MKHQETAPAPPSAADAIPTVPTIYCLTITRFRGIQELVWHPGRGVNIILGGGDVGKTTILDAVGLLFSPTNGSSISDTDYYRRNIDEEFVIEATVSLPFDTGIHDQLKPAWPWNWSGTQAVVPSADAEELSEPVYRLRVRGTADLELAYEILQPDGNADTLPVGLRRSIGLVRLSGDDRSDRDLRLVQGSALDRLLSDKALRSRIASELAKTDVENQLLDSGRQALADLDAAFSKQRLPNSLQLSITGGPGASIASLIGLTAARGGVQLPLANWGAGTRRLSALAIAEQNQGEHPLTLVDEIERGLEPYRQRLLLDKLQAGKSQVFITTHSPAAISAAAVASIWYVDHSGKIGALDATKIARHRKDDPDTFLSRLAIICEGVTEVGFVTALLERACGSPLQFHGIHISDGNGNDNTILLLEALSDGGLLFGCFADDEGTHPTRWGKITQAQGPLVFRWASGCIEQNIISAVADDKLEALLTDPTGRKTGQRLRTLADRLGISEKDFSIVSAEAGTGLKTLIIEAATGVVPAGKAIEANEYKSHAQAWFKTLQGGHELAAKALTLGPWAICRAQLLPFCNAVRKAVDLPDLADLPS